MERFTELQYENKTKIKGLKVKKTFILKSNMDKQLLETETYLENGYAKTIDVVDGGCVSFRYDNNNRLIERNISTEENNSTRYEYNDNNNVIAIHDILNESHRITKYNYIEGLSNYVYRGQDIPISPSEIVCEEINDYYKNVYILDKNTYNILVSYSLHSIYQFVKTTYKYYDDAKTISELNKTTYNILPDDNKIKIRNNTKIVYNKYGDIVLNESPFPDDSIKLMSYEYAYEKDKTIISKYKLHKDGEKELLNTTYVYYEEDDINKITKLSIKYNDGYSINNIYEYEYYEVK